MATIHKHTTHIRRPVNDVYDYITQPWRWHEWHPNSCSATRSVGTLDVDDAFIEVIELRPIPLLPLRMRRETSYSVLAARPPHEWVARGETRDGWVEIHYQLEPEEGWTKLERTIVFDLTGATRFLLPMLRRRQLKVSVLALRRLKDLLESHADQKPHSGSDR